MEVPGTVFMPPLTAQALNSAANGVSSPGISISSGWIKLSKIPIPIGPQVSFHVDMFTGSAVAALVTLLNTDSAALYTQEAELQVRLKGVFTRSQ